MDKPNYRLGKIGTILEATIITSLNLRKSTPNIGDKTFSWIFGCGTDSKSCPTYRDICSPTEHNHDGNCRRDGDCRVDNCPCQHDFSGYKCGCNPQCSCDSHIAPCSCDDNCEMYCPCVGN